MSKSAKYIVAIIILLAANLWLFFSGAGNKVKSSEKYFAPEDLQGASAFKFVYEGDTTMLSLSGEGWSVDNEYLADQGFVNTLISILERVEVGKTIDNWNSEILGSVEVEFDFNSRYRFDFASNANRTKSYFVTENGAKEVAVPGYRDNVIDIFILHADQWRDRLILDGSWRTIQNISVANDRGEDFQISFNEKFFLVNGQSATDSSAVVNYLNQFQQFQANEMISEGRFVEMDSIAKTQPFASISIDDIKYDQPIRLEFFPGKPSQPYHLVKDQDGQQMVIDARRVNQILSNPDRLN
ncbi:DUF4340 domain-containing protein [Ekhidna sp. To15]|uniref:DUF4340 domain-containing protein n=1 Tax=Ekhidna sp. To15 TaxID=3395267 RepID=UPI003F5283E3